MDPKMGKIGSSDHEEVFKAHALVWNHMFSFINSLSLKCAVELAIPDTIRDHGKPMTLPELASKLPIHPSKAHHLQRLMRLLTHNGFFALQKQGHDQEGYVLTHASRLLLRDNPFSVAPSALGVLDPRLTKPFECLTLWFQNGDLTPFVTAHGKTCWEYMPREPEFCSYANEAMAYDTRLVVKVLTDKCQDVFEGVNSLVDVGGNTGTLARGIAEAFPNIDCTVFDRPGMVDGLKGTNNLKFVGGDMFEAIPSANAIIMKWLMTDWSDEDCVKILDECMKAITRSGADKGKVIILEIVMGTYEGMENDQAFEAQLLFDMMTLGLVNGYQRNEREWAKLFTFAGFRDYKITPILGVRSLIEVYP